MSNFITGQGNKSFLSPSDSCFSWTNEKTKTEKKMFKGSCHIIYQFGKNSHNFALLVDSTSSARGCDTLSEVKTITQADNLLRLFLHWHTFIVVWILQVHIVLCTCDDDRLIIVFSFWRFTCSCKKPMLSLITLIWSANGRRLDFIQTYAFQGSINMSYMCIKQTSYRPVNIGRWLLCVIMRLTATQSKRERYRQQPRPLKLWYRLLGFWQHCEQKPETEHTIR